MRKFIVIFFASICLSMSASAASHRSVVRHIDLSRVSEMTYVDEKGRKEAMRVSAEMARTLAHEARDNWKKRSVDRAVGNPLPKGIPIKNSDGEVISYAVVSDSYSSSNENTGVVQFVPVKGETAEDLTKVIKIKLLSSTVWLFGGSLIVCLWFLFKQRLLSTASGFLVWLSDFVDSLEHKIKK
jgi:hypothetical protein